MNSFEFKIKKLGKCLEFLSLNEKFLNFSCNRFNSKSGIIDCWKTNGEVLLTVKTVDWKLLRCNSQNDHIGIHTGDWNLHCKSINERFPVLECLDGRQTESYANAVRKSLGPGNSQAACREQVRKGLLNNEYPTIVEIGSGTCWAMYDTEIYPKVLTAEPGIKTCFIRFLIPFICT